MYGMTETKCIINTRIPWNTAHPRPRPEEEASSTAGAPGPGTHECHLQLGCTSQG